MNWPGSPKVLLKATNVDGVSNALLEHGDDVPSWFDGGSVGVPWVMTDASNGLKRRRAHFKESDDNTAVMFDGVFSLLTSLSSKAALGFLHSPAVFDFFVVVRKLATSLGNTGTQRIIFGASDTGTAGLRVAIGDASLGEEGLVRVVLGSGGLTTVLLTSEEILVPVGDPYKLLVRCDGTTLSASHDFVNFETATVSTPLGSPGNAANDYSVGGAIPTQGIPNCLGADLLELAIYNSNNSAANLVLIRDGLETDFGEGV